MTFLRSSAIVAGSQAFSILVTLISRVLLGRLLGIGLYGEFGLALNTMTFLSRAFSFGVAPASQYFAGKERERQTEVVGSSLALGIPVGVLAALGVWAAQPWIHRAFFAPSHGESHEAAWQTFCSLMPMLGIVILMMNMGVLLIPFGKVKQYGVINAGFMLPFVILCGALGALGYRMDAAIWSQLTVWFMLFLYLLVQLREVLTKAKLDGVLTKQMAGYALRAWPNILLNIGVARFGTLLGAAYLGSHDLSLFVLGMNIVDALTAPYNSLGQLILQKSTDGAHTAPVVLRFMRLSLPLFAVMGVALALIGFWAIPLLFKADFGPAYGVSLALLSSSFFHAQFRTLSSFFSGQGRPELTTIGLVVEIALLVVSLKVLGPQFGLWGVVGCSIIASFAAWVTAAVSMAKIGGQGILAQLLVRPEDWADLKSRLKKKSPVPPADSPIGE